MDVVLMRSSVYALPSQRRVDAIVFDGAADLALWPGRGPDTDLREAWGGSLPERLSVARERLADGRMTLGEHLRLQPGQLHCDFLLWVAGREPEPGTERSPAPDAQTILSSVRSVLDFVAERDVARVAFSAFGHGADALDPVQRLELVVRAARAYEEARFSQGRAPGVEEVLVCWPDGAAVRKAESRVAGLAHSLAPQPRAAEREAPASARRGRGGARSGRSGSSTSGGEAKRSRAKAKKPALDPEEARQAKGTAERYDMRRTYEQGQWMLHPKFGVGRVEQVTPEGAIVVAFEDGEQRKMVHGRG